MGKLLMLRVNIQLLFLLSLLLISSKSMATAISNINSFNTSSIKTDNNNSDFKLTNSQVISSVSVSSDKLNSGKTLTPGQQLTLTITITYTHGIEIFFDVNKLNWQPFTFVNHQKTTPKWLAVQDKNDPKNGQWKIDYIIDLIVPLSGEYQLPEMILHSYWQQQYKSQIIQTPKIIVTSSFPSLALGEKIQPIEKVTESAEEGTKKISALNAFSISIMIIIVIIFILRTKSNHIKTKQSSYFNQNNPSNECSKLLDELILKANKDGEFHWEDLRQCMLESLGFDPLDEQINIQHLTLSNRYISARFTDSNKAIFIELCKRCQSNSKNTKISENIIRGDNA